MPISRASSRHWTLFGITGQGCHIGDLLHAGEESTNLSRLAGGLELIKHERFQVVVDIEDSLHLGIIFKTIMSLRIKINEDTFMLGTNPFLIRQEYGVILSINFISSS